MYNDFNKKYNIKNRCNSGFQGTVVSVQIFQWHLQFYCHVIRNTSWCDSMLKIRETGYIIEGEKHPYIEKHPSPVYQNVLQEAHFRI